MKPPRLTALITLLVLLRAAAFAQQQLPDVLHVVDKIGQEIQFEDEVKAVSYSQSTDGYYLSFGAPYPVQALSVWASAETYRKLTGHRVFVGRTVRIHGLLEASPDGPLLKVNAPEQLALLQTDESVLTKPTLDGKMERDQFMAAVAQNFAREDFATLEALAEELRQSRERLGDGIWLSDAFFSAFHLVPEATAERCALFESRLAHWETARPGSLVVLLVKAGFHRDLAWKSRTARSARKVTPEGWEGFRRELAVARQLLDDHPAAKMYPEYFCILQDIALGQGWPKADYFRLFDEATRSEPEYYKFYFNTACYLLPRWYGRKGEWEAFAEAQRQKHGAGGEGDALYTRIAWSLSVSYGRHFFHESAISWDVMAAGFDYLIKQYPDSRHLKNAYANFAWKAGDRARLGPALEAIRPDPDMEIWVNLENVRLAEHLANSTSPP